jgi:hypothetical protein
MFQMMTAILSMRSLNSRSLKTENLGPTNDSPHAPDAKTHTELTGNIRRKTLLPDSLRPRRFSIPSPFERQKNIENVSASSDP